MIGAGHLASAQTAADPENLLADLDAARAETLALVAELDDEQLRELHSPLMSPLVWDLGHIAAYEDLWLAARAGGLELLRPDLAELYDAFETPRATRATIEMLGPAESREYLARVRERVRELGEREGVGDGRLHELVVRHERQHNETMLQTLNLARLHDWAPPGRVAAGGAGAGGGADGDGDGDGDGAGASARGLELVEVPAGEFVLGAGEDGFAYDNERPQQTVALDAFRIGRTAVTNADWLAFVDDGGYRRREHWSEAGWAWRCEERAEHPLNWSGDPASGFREWRLGGFEPLAPGRTVVHVSWFEADAFARAHGLRLPTEAEWEKAATWEPQTGLKRRFPWGRDDPSREHANLVEGRRYGTTVAGAHRAGAAPCGALGMIGDVWEWTASCFDGYDGFVAHPYREYSEVFFGNAYRVLRGGSWATSARVATPTFRNWDHPQRRQIFAGLRLASDG